jgi:hypothetical protein
MAEIMVDFGSKPNIVSVLEMDEDINILIQNVLNAVIK